MTDDLVAFLRARLDEDEQAARACSGDGRWTEEVLAIALPEPDLGHQARRHISRHDPARILAEVDAKRRILALHDAEPGQHPDFCWHDKHELPCPTLRLLALPYDDHPDYRPGQRP